MFLHLWYRQYRCCFRLADVERHTAHIFVDEWPPATVAEDVLWAQRPEGSFWPSTLMRHKISRPCGRGAGNRNTWLKHSVYPMVPNVLLIIIPIKNGYFIGKINLFSDKPIWWYMMIYDDIFFGFYQSVQTVFCLAERGDLQGFSFRRPCDVFLVGLLWVQVWDRNRDSLHFQSNIAGNQGTPTQIYQIYQNWEFLTKFLHQFRVA